MQNRFRFYLQLGFTLLVCAFLIVPVILSMLAGLTVNYLVGIESGLSPLFFVFSISIDMRKRFFSISPR